ncbi:MAG TPA: hypothetical protein VK837_05820 [Longimicrobiales bacterium]|nr:hypothetical protein [Longimicrobiales bacterium]
MAGVGLLKARRPFSAGESRRLEQALRNGEPVACPRCGADLAASEVRKPPEVAYVRTRTLLVCPGCGASGAVEARVADG